MDLGPEARPIGDVLKPMFARLAAEAQRLGLVPPPAYQTDASGDDRPGWFSPTVATLRHVAIEAKARGAIASLTARGLLISKAGRCELVPWQDVEFVEILDRVLGRVAPYDWELEE